MPLLKMPQNVILSKNLSELQGKRDNPQLSVLNIHLSETDRTNKASERLKKKIVKLWNIQTRSPRLIQ